MGANSWTKSGSGAWSTGADWSSGSAPGAATDVLLGGGLAETLVLASGTNAVVHSLTLTDAAATISLAGATLTTSGGVFASGTVDRAGTLASTGAVAVSGLVLGGGAVWANQRVATLTGTLALGDITGGAATIANSGSVLLAADAAGISGNIYLDANATTELGSGLLLNTGLLEKVAGTGTSAIAAAIAGAGTIGAITGTLELDGGGTLAGSIGGSGGGWVDLGAGTFDLASSLRVSGALAQTGGAVALGVGQTLTLAGLARFGEGAVGGGDVDGPGTLLTTGTTSVLDYAETELNLGGGLNWINAGTVADGGAIAAGDLTGGALTITNQAGAAFLLTDDASGLFQNGWLDASNAWQSGAGTLVDAGLLAKTAGSLASQIFLPLFTTGTVIAESGTLELDGGGTLAGTLAGLGGVLALGGGGFSLGTAALTLAGSVALTGATINLATHQSLTLPGGALLDGGLVSGPGTLLTPQGAVLDGVSLAGGAVWANAGSVSATGAIQIGAPAGAGHIGTATLQNLAGAVVALAGDAAGLVGGGALQNAGTLEKTAGTGTSQIVASITGVGTVIALSGTLALDGGGTLAGALGGAGGEVALGAGLFAMAGTTLATTGTFGLSGGTVVLGSGQDLRLASAALLQSGVVQGPGTLETDAATQLGALTLGGSAQWRNLGSVTLAGLVLVGNAAGLAGTISNAAGATLALSSGASLAPALVSGAEGQGTLVNAGLVTLSGGTASILLALSGTGTLALGTGTLDLAGGGALAGTVSGAGALLVGGGQLVAAAGLVLGEGRLIAQGGEFDVLASLASAAAFTLDGGALRIGAGASLTLGGADLLEGGTLEGAGMLATTGNGTLQGQLAAGIVLETGALWRNQGSLLLNGQIDDFGGTVVNASGATLVFASGSGFEALAAGATLINTGLISQQSGTVTDIGAYLQSTGSIAIGGGGLALLGGGALSGAISGTTLILAGGTTNLAAGLALSTTLGLQAGLAMLSGTLVDAAGLALSGGTLALASSASFRGPLQASLGEIDGPGTLPGTMYVSQGAIAAGDSVTLGGGLDLAITGTLALDGEVVVGDAAGGGATINVTPGAVLLAASNGGIAAAPGGAGVLVVAGRLEVQGGTSQVAAALLASGVLRIDAGTLALDAGGTLGGQIGGAELALVGGSFAIATGLAFTATLALDGGLLGLQSGQTLVVSNQLLAMPGGFATTLDGPGVMQTRGQASLDAGGIALSLGGGMLWQNPGSLGLVGTLALGDAAGSATLDNTGLMVVAAGAAVIANVVFNAAFGELVPAAATLENAAQIEFEGNAAVGATLDSSAELQIDTGTLVAEAGGTLAGAVQGAGTMLLEQGRMFWESGLDLMAAVVLAGADVQVSGHVAVQGGLDASTGTLSLAAGAALTAQSALELGGWGWPELDGPGTLETDGTTQAGLLVIGGGLVWRNQGDLVITAGIYAGDLAGPGATLDNLFGGTIEVAASGAGLMVNGVAAPSGMEYGAPVLINAGLVAQLGGGIALFAGAITNTGTIAADGGTLVLGDVAGDGVLSIGAGGVLDLAGAAAGTVAFTAPGGTLILSQPFAFTGTLGGLANGAQLVLPGLGVTGARLVAGTLALSGTEDAGGAAFVLNLAVTGNPDLNVSVAAASGSGVASLAPSGGLDVSGTGATDLLWESTSGQAAIWELSGLSLVGSALIAQPGPQWNEMAIGNFSGAGRNDILWQANDGALAVWQMDGTQIAAGAQIGNLGTAWHVVGVADFAGVSASAAVPQNGDDAILLQNDDGALSLWQMDGLAVASEVALPDPGPDWQVVGVGDLDGNGRQDIVLEDGGGDVAVWGMQGSTIVASAIIANVGQNWHVAAIADVNGDGRDDILWQSNQGATAEWELNGLAIQSSAVLGDPGPSWHLKGAGPEIAGTVDLVWQQDGGNTAMWQVVSGTLSQGAVLANPGLTWQTLGSDEMRFVQPNSAVLTAAIGPNEFMFAGAATGSYTIQAFDPMIDVIAVPGSVFPGFASLETRLTAGPTGAMLNLGAATITITGVSIGALQPRNFLFE